MLSEQHSKNLHVTFTFYESSRSLHRICDRRTAAGLKMEVRPAVMVWSWEAELKCEQMDRTRNESISSAGDGVKYSSIPELELRDATITDFKMIY